MNCSSSLVFCQEQRTVEYKKQRGVKDTEILKKTKKWNIEWKIMTKKWKKTQVFKDKIYLFFWNLLLKKAEHDQRTNHYKSKIQRNRYMKIGTLFSATKAMIPNDANPFGRQPKKPRTHRNK